MTKFKFVSRYHLPIDMTNGKVYEGIFESKSGMVRFIDDAGDERTLDGGWFEEVQEDRLTKLLAKAHGAHAREQAKAAEEARRRKEVEELYYELDDALCGLCKKDWRFFTLSCKNAGLDNLMVSASRYGCLVSFQVFTYEGKAIIQGTGEPCLDVDGAVALVLDKIEALL